MSSKGMSILEMAKDQACSNLLNLSCRRRLLLCLCNFGLRVGQVWTHDLLQLSLDPTWALGADRASPSGNCSSPTKIPETLTPRSLNPAGVRPTPPRSEGHQEHRRTPKETKSTKGSVQVCVVSCLQLGSGTAPAGRKTRTDPASAEVKSAGVLHMIFGTRTRRDQARYTATTQLRTGCAPYI